MATVSPTGQDENPIFKRSIFDSGPRFRGREPFLSHPSELRQILIEVMDRPSTESDHSGHDPRIEDFTQATTENVPETRAHVIAGRYHVTEYLIVLLIFIVFSCI